MPTLQEQIEQAVVDITDARDVIVEDTDTLHGIVHGPSSGPTSTVETDNGDVSTVSRVLSEIVALAGTAAGMLYHYDSATADADPGDGDFRLNNANISLANFLYIDDADRGGNNTVAHVTEWDASDSLVKGYVFLTRISDGAQSILRVTGTVTDASGYNKVPVEYVSGATSFTNTDPVTVQFYRTGDVGLHPYVDIRLHGGVGDGVTPDDAALDAAIAAANGTPVWLPVPPVAWLFEDDHELSSGSHIIAASDAHIVFAGAQWAPLFWAVGTVDEDEYLLSSSTGPGEFHLGYFADLSDGAAEIQRGDWIFIGSEAVDGGSNSILLGDLKQVLFNDSGRLVFDTPLQQAYSTSDNAYVKKWTPVENITIEGGIWHGAGAYPYGGSPYIDPMGGTAENDLAHNFLTVYYGHNIKVRNLSLYDFHALNINLVDVVSSRVTHVNFYNANYDSAGYGVSINNACHDHRTESCSFRNLRHPFAQGTGGGGVGGLAGITRDFWVTDCNVYDTAGQADAFSTHTCFVGGHFHRNKFHGANLFGILARGGDVSICDNEITGSSRAAIWCVREPTFTGCSAIISGNTIRNTRRYQTNIAISSLSGFFYEGERVTDGTNQGYVLSFLHWSGGQRLEVLVTSGTFTTGTLTGLVSGATATISSVTAPESTGMGIRIGNLTSGVISNNDIDEALHDNYPLYFENSDEFTIVGNRMRAQGSRPCILFVGSSNSDIVIEANVFRGGSGTAVDDTGGTPSNVIKGGNVKVGYSTEYGF